MVKSTDTNAPIGEEIGRKLSAKEVGWSKAEIMTAVLANRNDPVFLFRVVGMATGVMPYESDYGDGFALLGTFEATTDKGDVFPGSSLYLPGYIQNMLVSGLQGAGEGAAIRVGIDVYAQFDEDAATSYVFTGRSLLKADTQAVDAVKALIGDMPMPASRQLENKS